jgi:hypothetical protein
MVRPAFMPHVGQRGGRWTQTQGSLGPKWMDIADLTHSLAYGNTFADAASFLGKSRRAERSDADAGKKPASHQGFHNTVGATLNHKVRSSPLLDLPVFIERVQHLFTPNTGGRQLNHHRHFLRSRCPPGLNALVDPVLAIPVSRLLSLGRRH